MSEILYSSKTIAEVLSIPVKSMGHFRKKCGVASNRNGYSIEDVKKIHDYVHRERPVRISRTRHFGTAQQLRELLTAQ